MKNMKKARCVNCEKPFSLDADGLCHGCSMDIMEAAEELRDIYDDCASFLDRADLAEAADKARKKASNRAAANGHITG